MNRLFLALLALLAGLAAQIAPAHARVEGNESAEISSVEATRCARPCAAQSPAAEIPSARPERREKETARTRPQRARVFIPAVYMRADRAFE